MASATFLLALMLACGASAESRLPPCPANNNTPWTNCHGTLTLPDGVEYVGAFKNGKPNGQGTGTKPDGEKYVGAFKDGHVTGQGTRTWPNGEKYVGEFKDGKPNGQGTYTWPDGRKYVGEFEDDKRNGKGTYTWPDGRIYVGEWTNDTQVEPSAENSSNKATTSALGLREKSNGYLFLILLAIAGISVIFLMKDRTEPSIRVQQDEQKREKEEAEAAARERQRQQEEQYRRHDSSSGKMNTDQAVEILGLKSGATEEEIRAAYNRLMKRVHPDVGGSGVFAKLLNRARDVLIE